MNNLFGFLSACVLSVLIIMTSSATAEEKQLGEITVLNAPGNGPVFTLVRAGKEQQIAEAFTNVYHLDRINPDPRAAMRFRSFQHDCDVYSIKSPVLIDQNEPCGIKILSSEAAPEPLPVEYRNEKFTRLVDHYSLGTGPTRGSVETAAHQVAMSPLKILIKGMTDSDLDIVRQWRAFLGGWSDIYVVDDDSADLLLVISKDMVVIKGKADDLGEWSFPLPDKDKVFEKHLSKSAAFHRIEQWCEKNPYQPICNTNESAPIKWTVSYYSPSAERCSGCIGSSSAGYFKPLGREPLTIQGQSKSEVVPRDVYLSFTAENLSPDDYYVYVLAYTSNGRIKLIPDANIEAGLTHYRIPAQDTVKLSRLGYFNEDAEQYYLVSSAVKLDLTPLALPFLNLQISESRLKEELKQAIVRPTRYYVDRIVLAGPGATP